MAKRKAKYERVLVEGAGRWGSCAGCAFRTETAGGMSRCRDITENLARKHGLAPCIGPIGQQFIFKAIDPAEVSA